MARLSAQIAGQRTYFVEQILTFGLSSLCLVVEGCFHWNGCAKVIPIPAGPDRAVVSPRAEQMLCRIIGWGFGDSLCN
jgi:hypothetical protein